VTNIPTSKPDVADILTVGEPSVRVPVLLVFIALSESHPTISVLDAILHKNFSGREATKNLAPASNEGSKFLLLLDNPVKLFTFSQSLIAMSFLNYLTRFGEKGRKEVKNLSPLA
jgi:hypothetical protein